MPLPRVKAGLSAPQAGGLAWYDQGPFRWPSFRLERGSPASHSALSLACLEPALSAFAASPNQSLWPQGASRDAQGELWVGGCRLSDLAQAHGTPLWVLDEATLRATCQAYVQALAKHYPAGGRVLYASKAHCTMALMALIASEGLDFDVVSAGEMHTALQAGIPASRLVMQGNNKSPDELRYGLKVGVGRINVDNLAELALLLQLCEAQEAKVQVLLRVAPGIEAHTHEAIRTGQEDSKFGLDLKSGQLDEAVAMLKGQERVRLVGLQAHIGSQIFDVAPYAEAAEVMVALLADVKAKHGLELPELDLGGGLGVVYVAGDDPPSIEEAVAATAQGVLAACQRHGLKPPHLVLEPGRSIVATAGLSLYTVGGLKEVPGVRRYLAVDGGMADNPRPLTYGAEYSFALASREGGAQQAYRLVGRYCESGDVLADEVWLPSPQRGEVVVTFVTGAYNHAMASNYNRVGRPAMVLVNQGQAEVVVAREGLDDLLRQDRLPARLKGAGVGAC